MALSSNNITWLQKRHLFCCVLHEHCLLEVNLLFLVGILVCAVSCNHSFVRVLAVSTLPLALLAALVTMVQRYLLNTTGTHSNHCSYEHAYALQNR
jgi:hypothetical protein